MQKDINKVFVLGGSGFIGRYLIKELIKDDLEIQCLVNQSPLPIESSKIKIVHSSLTQFEWKELNNDMPDVIIHAARLSANNIKERQEVSKYGAEANQRLVTWLSSLSDPPLLIFVSGTLVYGSHANTLVDETFKPNPISFQREYFEAEKPILEALTSKTIPVIIARPCWIYGSGSWLHAFYLNPSRKNKKIAVYGKGKNYMSFIHVRDCAGMIKHLATQGTAGNIYNLYAQEALKQKDFVKILADSTKKSVGRKSVYWLKLRQGNAVYEAFTFSLRSDSIHKKTFDDYKFYFPKIEDGLMDIINCD